MKVLNSLLVVSALLALSSVSVSAQAAKVICKDGTKSNGGQGACSSHGGVAPVGETKAEMKETRKSEKAAAKADEKMEPKAERKAEAKVDEKKESKAEKKSEKMAANEKDATGAIAECKDHTYSHAKAHRGSCSRHGGVEKFLDGKK